MTRRSLVKLCLAAIALAATTLPARAGLVTVVNEFDGVNLSYVATVTPTGGGTGVLQIAFNSTNLVATYNGGNTFVPPLNAIFTGVAFPNMNPATNVYTTTYTTSPATGGALNVNDLNVGPIGTAGGDIGVQDF